MSIKWGFERNLMVTLFGEELARLNELNATFVGKFREKGNEGGCVICDCQLSAFIGAQ